MEVRFGREPVRSFSVLQPLLTPEWLSKPADDIEAGTIASVRAAHLPNIVLAYISALYFSGHHISREILLNIMSLAIDVAADGSPVQAVFVETGSMSRLMDALAVGSFGIARAEEQMAKQRGAGKGKRGKPGPKGENLDIWKMKVPVNAVKTLDD